MRFVNGLNKVKDNHNMSINWFPGHMHKATKAMKEALPKVDVIIEVLDARIPYSSANPVIATMGSSKPNIKLLNKCDLADSNITQQWLTHFEQQDRTKALAVSSLTPDKIRRVQELCTKLAAHKADKAQPIHALIVGIPNVGKSTIINILANRSVAKTGNEPAITKAIQAIKLNEHIMLHDTPGILWPNIHNQHSAYRLACIGSIKETAISIDDIAFFAVEYLLKAYPEALAKRYQLNTPPKDEMDFFEQMGQLRGCLGKGGRVDINKVAKLLLMEFREAIIGTLSLETPSMAVKEAEETLALIQRKAEEKAAKKAARRNKPKHS